MQTGRGAKPTRAKMQERRARLCTLGLRPIQIWVPDVRASSFKSEAHRQSLVVARSARANKDLELIDAVSEWRDE